eukprot:COSAG01_NODE_3964_length_5490_cov_36.725283_4_plen_461_part_00
MYGIVAPRPGGTWLVAAEERSGGVSSAEKAATRLDWTARRGKGVVAAREIAEGDVLWREEALCALQSVESRAASAIGCSDTLAFVGSLPEQLQVAGRYSDREVEQGRAEISSELTALLQQTRCAWSWWSVRPKTERISMMILKLCALCRAAAQPLAPQFVLSSAGDIYASAAVRDAAAAAYAQRLGADAAAWSAFQEHAEQTNEAFVLAARIIASSGVDRGIATALQHLLSAVWWELSPPPLPTANTGDDSDTDTGPTTPDLATSRRILLEQSHTLLREVLKASKGPPGAIHMARMPEDEKRIGEESVPLEMYARLMGVLELNSIEISVQSPLAAVLGELLDTTEYHRKDDRCRMSATDLERCAALMLPHVLRRVALLNSEHGEDCGATSELDRLRVEPPAAKRQRRMARQSPTEVEKLREVVGSVDGGLDTIFPALKGVGLFEGVANLNHSCVVAHTVV